MFDDFFRVFLFNFYAIDILLDILHLKCIISTNKEIYYGPELYRENVGADHQKGRC
jgi:hypothetical protein